MIAFIFSSSPLPRNVDESTVPHPTTKLEVWIYSANYATDA
jgi:hypothetical protein